MTDGLRPAALTALRRAGGRAPAAVGSAPGRVVIVGEGADDTGGLALPFTVDRTVMVAIGAARRGWTVAGPEAGAVVAVARLAPVGGPATRWAAHVLAVLQGLRDRGLAVPPCHVGVATDLPPGVGLGTAAALEVATLLAALRWLGAQLPALEAARLCQGAARRCTGSGAGLVDRVAVVAGDTGEALRLDGRLLAARPVLPLLVAATPVPLDLPGCSWYLLDRGGPAGGRGDGSRPRRREWAAVRRRLAGAGVDLRALRPGDVARVTPGWPDPLPARLAHAVGENRRVELVARAAGHNRPDRVGRWLLDAHRSRRDHLAVADPVGDRLVQAVTRVPGVAGARAVGRGAGGAVLVLAVGSPAGGRLPSLRRAAAVVVGRPVRGWPLQPGSGAAAGAPEVLVPDPAAVDLFGAGISLFNRGEYFEAHECLEACWRVEPAAPAAVAQGILQVGVGLHHARRGNQPGALRLVERGLARLRPAGAVARGLDLAGFVAAVERSRERIAAGRPGQCPPGPLPRLNRAGRRPARVPG